MNWVVIRTIPTHRVEFKVLHRINQEEHQAMLPFEIVWEKKRGKRHPIERKYALFPRYVFAGLANVEEDFKKLRDNVPEIQGVVNRRPGEWSPFIMSESQVQFVRELVDGGYSLSGSDLHKALRPGRNVEVTIGGATQVRPIDAVTKKGVRVMLEMFNKMHLVDVPFSAVRAA